jgi:putative tryptophan/tyrosine transport system substrate-binding protein
MQFDRMKRREFITLLGGAVAGWPVGVGAQPSAMPVIGPLSGVALNTRRDQLGSFRHGLAEAGFIEGQSVAIEYRSADSYFDRLPALAADLVKRNVNVIVTIGGDVPISAAKNATTAIPVVFVTGFDPVQAGFVASMNRPGGNLTGVSFLTALTLAKRLELLIELVPGAAVVGILVNPGNPNSERSGREAREAADRLGKKLVVVPANSEQQINDAFTTLSREKAEAVLVEADPVFLARRQQIIVLATRDRLPALYAFREFVTAGGLMSYGSSLSDAYRQAGVYAGKILKGEKAADLPVIQAIKFELVINLQTANALGIKVPLSLQVAADEVIE